MQHEAPSTQHEAVAFAFLAIFEDFSTFDAFASLAQQAAPGLQHSAPSLQQAGALATFASFSQQAAPGLQQAAPGLQQFSSAVWTDATASVLVKAKTIAATNVKILRIVI